MLLHFTIPFLCALVFPAGAYLLKRAQESGRDSWGVLIVSNLAVTAAFIPPLLWIRPGLPPLTLLYQPFLCGVFFFAGQAAAYRSFAGDLSVAVPAQGSKVLWIALFTWIFLGQAAGWRIWAAAILALLAFYFLRERPPGKAERRKLFATFGAATLAAILLAALDTGIQAWSPSWNPWVFGFWTFLFQGIFSAALWLFPAGRRMFGYSRETWKAALGGSAVMAAISFGLVWVISASGKAAWVNILFSSRVVTGVVFVSMWGRALGIPEAGRRGSRKILAHHLAGAALMLIAIVLALL
jgi:drug/metabolite transporter (DMT)-like permease